MRDPRWGLYETLISRVEAVGPTSEIHEFGIELCDVRLRIITQSARIASRVRDYFRAYLIAPDQCTEVEARLFDGPVDFNWEREDPEFEILDDGAIQRDFVARWATHNRAGAVLAGDNDDGLHNFLRWILPPLLLKRDALLLHGAAVIRDGVGHVFFGPSGAGKSTTVSLITEHDRTSLPIGDDAVIVRLAADGAWVHAAPLGSGYTRDAPPKMSAPIRGFYRLRQSDENAITAIPKSQAAGELIASAMAAKFDEDASERLELCLAFAGARPGIHELHFTKNPGFWDLLPREIVR